VQADEKQELLRRFGASVRDHRRRAGLSQEKLAALAGLDRTYVGGIERGERNVAVINIVRLARALGMRPAELMNNLDWA
jgi:transcriptional regulator with XRE-family HTH domain